MLKRILTKAIGPMPSSIAAHLDERAHRRADPNWMEKRRAETAASAGEARSWLVPGTVFGVLCLAAGGWFAIQVLGVHPLAAVAAFAPVVALMAMAWKRCGLAETR